MQGRGRIGRLAIQTPVMIRFGADTEDEVFITHEAAPRGVEVENTGSEPLVGCATSARTCTRICRRLAIIVNRIFHKTITREQQAVCNTLALSASS